MKKLKVAILPATSIYAVDDEWSHNMIHSRKNSTK